MAGDSKAFKTLGLKSSTKAQSSSACVLGSIVLENSVSSVDAFVTTLAPGFFLLNRLVNSVGIGELIQPSFELLEAVLSASGRDDAEDMLARK